MRTNLLAGLIALLTALSSCSDNTNRYQFMPVKLQADGPTTLMAPDGSTTDYYFQGRLSPVVNGYFTVRMHHGTDVYRYGKSEPEAIESLQQLYHAGMMSDGLIPVRRREGAPVEFVDTKGATRFTLDKKYRCGNFFAEGVMPVRDDDWNWGAINTEGHTIVPLKYRDINYCSEGVMTALRDDQWVLLDKEGREIRELEGVMYIGGVVSRMHCGLIAVRKDGRFGLMNRDGEFTDLGLKESVEINGFNGRYAIISDNDSGNSGVVDTNGREVLPAEYLDIKFFGDRFFCHVRDDEYRIIDHDGEVLTTLQAPVVQFIGANDWPIEGQWLMAGRPGDMYLYDTDGERIENSHFYSTDIRE